MSLQVLNTIIVYIGIPTIAGALIFIGVKLHTLTVIEKSVDKIKFNMKVMTDYLTRHHTQFDPKELKAMSPLQLTEAGMKLITETGFEEVFAAHKAEFFAVITEEQPKVKYDVELAATKSLYLLVDQDYMQFLKVFLYNNPEKTMENTTPTFGVYIRDQYLAAHPEITE